jgi:hypothetical protein
VETRGLIRHLIAVSAEGMITWEISTGQKLARYAALGASLRRWRICVRNRWAIRRRPLAANHEAFSLTPHGLARADMAYLMKPALLPDDD